MSLRSKTRGLVAALLLVVWTAIRASKATTYLLQDVEARRHSYLSLDVFTKSIQHHIYARFTLVMHMIGVIYEYVVPTNYFLNGNFQIPYTISHPTPQPTMSIHDPGALIGLLKPTRPNPVPFFGVVNPTCSAPAPFSALPGSLFPPFPLPLPVFICPVIPG